MEKSIKLKRTESILRELIPEALATLSDERISSIPVLDVVCSRGKYDARVFLDPTFLDEEEERYALKHLARASSYLENYCKQAEGWFRCPKFHFLFDHDLERQNKMDDLFKQIESELEKHHDA